MDKFSDYLLGFTQTENFVNIGAFAKQSAIFQTIAMDGGGLANITWVFALLGAMYLFFNPASWKATIIGPWLFFLVLFQSGKLGDPLFFKEFNFNTDFDGTYLHCAGINGDAVPQVMVNETTGKVEHRCTANETGNGAEPNSAHTNFDENGVRDTTTQADLLKLQGVDITSADYSSIYAYSPQLYLIDTLVRLQAIMAETLLHEMDRTSSGLIQSARAARTLSLIDKRPTFESNMFQAACGDVEGSENVVFLPADEANDRFPRVMSDLKRRKLSLFDILSAFAIYHKALNDRGEYGAIAKQGSIRPPFVAEYIVTPRYGGDLTDDVAPLMAQINGTDIADKLEWSNITRARDFLAILSRNMEETKSPLGLLYVDENIMTALLSDFITFNDGNTSRELQTERVLREHADELFQTLNFQDMPVEDAEAVIAILKSVQIKEVYFGNQNYSPLSKVDLSKTLGDEAAKSELSDQYKVAGGASSVTIDNTLSTASASGVSCAEYHTYLSNLIGEAVTYQVEAYKKLGDLYDLENKAKMSHLARLLSSKAPECLSTGNIGYHSSVRTETQVLDLNSNCDVEKLKGLMLAAGPAEMERLHAEALRNYAVDPEFSDTMSGWVKNNVTSEAGKWVFDGENGDIVLSVVNAMQGFATGSFAALMPRFVSWMTALLIVMTPFLYMMGLLVPAWSMSILIMPLIAVLYLQSVQIVYVVIKGAFSGLDAFIVSGGEQSLHLAMYDLILGVMYISVFLLTAFMLFNLNDAGALVKQMSGKLDSAATIDAKEVLAGAASVAALASVPGKIAGAGMGAVSAAGNFANSGNILTNAAGTVAGAWNEGAEAGVDRKHKNLNALKGGNAKAKNEELTLQSASDDANIGKTRTGMFAKTIGDKSGNLNKDVAKDIDGQRYEFGKGADQIAGFILDNNQSPKEAQKVAINVKQAINKHGGGDTPVFNNENQSVEQKVPVQVIEAMTGKVGAEMRKAIAGNEKFRVNDKGETFISFGKVPKAGKNSSGRSKVADESASDGPNPFSNKS